MPSPTEAVIASSYRTTLALIALVCPSLGGEVEFMIVGGAQASIAAFPHSSHLACTCRAGARLAHWYCGASVVNQLVLLSAGHCLEDCAAGSRIIANFGSSTWDQGLQRSVARFKVHEDYEHSAYIMRNDISLSVLKRPLELGPRVSRVAIMQDPPYDEPAWIGGWGAVDEAEEITSPNLLKTNLKLWDKNKCQREMGELPSGVFCAGPRGTSYVARGDSGSALVVRGYIQIGLTSFKKAAVSRTLVVFTDVGYFSRWIEDNVAALCS